MSEEKVYTAIGLMSGTSLDGVDAALIKTDGRDHAKPLGFLTLPYEESLRKKIRACLGVRDREGRDVKEAERLLTFAHIDAVKRLLKETGRSVSDIDVIGFHGQTLFHNPAEKITLQIGDGALMAYKLGIDVIGDFRSADVAAGGQGAPFLPLYHRARATKLEKPLAVLNIGGVANVTWIGEGPDDILSFDTGPGNALMDDFIYERTGKPYDAGGALAAKGKVHEETLQGFLSHAYFVMPAPKSLDRNNWDISLLEYLGPEDALATLAAFTAESVAIARRFFPAEPACWLVSGGGRHNDFLMQKLGDALAAPVKPVEDLGWNGDALEAEGFAWLAVRSLLGLPLSLPGTTGVPQAATGGKRHVAGG